MNRKSRSGPHFEDFHVGMHIVHPTPRTLTEGDRSLYIGLTGSRDPLVSATTTSALAGVPGVIGHDEERKGKPLRAIEFPRIKGGKSFDVSAKWFGTLLKEIGQPMGKKAEKGAH